MSNTDEVINDAYYVETDQLPDYVINLDVRLNMIVTFLVDMDFQAGQHLVIPTHKIQKILKSEFQEKQNRQLMQVKRIP